MLKEDCASFSEGLYQAILAEAIRLRGIERLAARRDFDVIGIAVARVREACGCSDVQILRAMHQVVPPGPPEGSA
jgi:hypothetical protein